MAITAGQPIVAADFVGTSSGAGDSGKVPKLDANGKIPVEFFPSVFLGMVLPYAGRSSPDASWKLCDGAAISRSTYAVLFAILCPTLGTVTITIASPGVVTLNAHGLATGDSIYLTTTGALPTGLSANTRYWVIKIDANTFNLATSLANALAGTKINTSGSQSGTHTAVLCPYGLGDGSTTFNLPNMKGSIPVGLNQSDAEFAGLGQTGGEKTHVLTVPEIPSHTHDIKIDGGGGQSGAVSNNNTGTNSASAAAKATGGDGAHNNIQPYVTVNYLMRVL